ncbi:hypothetical protein HMPREF0208_03037 [Citrobacter koseri]|nr:hypothetical protein HMPREF3220_02127 [Citrobacter koseri]KXB42812.1 hypothetical protein HMPREF0208_03037 [Citrobacter koseri]
MLQRQDYREVMGITITHFNLHLLISNARRFTPRKQSGMIAKN